jgi:hypothetical protein
MVVLIMLSAPTSALAMDDVDCVPMGMPKGC